MTHTLTPSSDTSMDDLDGLARVLTADGERVPEPLLDRYLDDVDGGMLRDLYRQMAVLRRIDAEGVALQRQGQLGLWAPCRGQEATQIGTASAFAVTDQLLPSCRETGVLLVRGADPASFVRQWRGDAHSRGARAGRGRDLHLGPAQIIIGAQTLHAVGYAMGIQRDEALSRVPAGAGEVAACYFGDGATSQGDVNEAMIFAASYGAPVVFICSNNHYAISEPVGLQAPFPIVGRAPGFGIPSLRVDGNDVLACLAAARWAAEHAREGSGPAFIEAVTYRMGPHTTADDPTRYRSDDEVACWAARDPLARVEAQLRDMDAWSDDFARDVARACDDQAAAVRAACLEMEPGDPMRVFDHVYAEPHTGLARQRAAYGAYLADFADATVAAAVEQ